MKYLVPSHSRDGSKEGRSTMSNEILYGVQLPEPGSTKAERLAEDYAGKLRSAGFQVSTSRQIVPGVPDLDPTTGTVRVTFSVHASLRAENDGLLVRASWVTGSHGRTRFDGVQANFRSSKSVRDLEALCSLASIQQWHELPGWRRFGD